MSDERTTYFVTGGTGFIGRALVDRLIRRGGELRLLVRADTRRRQSARLADWADRARERGGDLRVIEGDLTQAGLGLADPSVARADHVFHIAALYDLDADADSLRGVNVDGTRHLLDLLDGANFDGLLHFFSSIAVAGDYRGRFLETMFEEGQRWPHPYQQTKAEAERLVRGRAGIRQRIYRPGAVVGDSHTGAADRVDGLYFLFKPLQRLQRTVPSWVPLAAPSGAGLPVVPVDFVADAIDHLAHQPGLDGRTFHVLDPQPLDQRRTLDVLSRAAGGPRFHVTLPTGKLGGLGNAATLFLGRDAVDHWRRRLARRFGAPPSVLDALNSHVTFDTTELDGALSGSGLSCPPLRRYAKTLWRYWEDHLDPDRDREAKTRRKLAEQRIVITGASSGIGEALAKLCGSYGARVVLVARRAERLEEVAAQVEALGGQALVLAADLRSPEDCQRVVDRVVDELGGADILVNNAGKSIRRTIVDSLDRFHDFERMMQLNYFGAVRLTLGLLPAMREQGHGRIVNMLTSGVWVGTPLFGAYLASKRALDAFSDSLAAELHHEGIRVCDVYLPLVRTPMIAPSGAYDDAPMMEVDDAARWVLNGIVDGERRLAPLWAKLIGLIWVVDPKGHTKTTNNLFRATQKDKAVRADVALERRLLRTIGLRGSLF